MSILEIILNSIIAIVIAVSFGWIHEYLHMRKAKQLGLEVTKGKRFQNVVYVNTDDPILSKQIANAPYKVLIPISIGILVVGVYFFQLGLIAGASATILIHIISYRLEGRCGESVRKKENI